MKTRKKFRATKAAQEVLLTVDSLRRESTQLFKEQQYKSAALRARIADRLYNEVVLDKLAYTLELS
jgi:hypothetical protein